MGVRICKSSSLRSCFFGASLLLAACSSQPVIDAPRYTSPAGPVSELAEIDVFSDVQLTSIDHVHVKKDGPDDEGQAVTVTPGEHRISILMTGQGPSQRGYARWSFNLHCAKGHRYEVQGANDDRHITVKDTYTGQRITVQ